MKKIIFVFVLAVFGFCVLGIKKDGIIVPIFFEENFAAPLVKAEIQGKSCSLVVDLGFWSHLMLDEEILSNLNKKPWGAVSFSSHKGVYRSKKYIIPQVRLGNIDFFEPVIIATNEDFYSDVLILNREPPQRNGFLGRGILMRENLFLDFPHSRMAFVFNEKHIKKMGYALKDMTKVPFEMALSGVILNVMTDWGQKRFALDSGHSTNDLIVPSNKMPKMEEGKIYSTTTSKFIIGDKDFGKLELYPCEKKTDDRDDRDDAILGLSFMMHHPIYLDFKNKIAYIGDYQ